MEETVPAVTALRKGGMCPSGHLNAHLLQPHAQLQHLDAQTCQAKEVLGSFPYSTLLKEMERSSSAWSNLNPWKSGEG